MASSDKKPGAGLAAMLLELRKKQQQENESEQQSQIPQSPSGVARGSALSSYVASSTASPGATTISAGRGRAAALSLALGTGPVGTPIQQEVPTSLSPRGSSLMSIGRGRAAALSALLEAKSVGAPIQQKVTTSLSSSTVSVGRGRATLIGLMSGPNPESALPPEEVSTATYSKQSLLGLVRKTTSSEQPLLSEHRRVPEVPGPPVVDTAGVLGQLSELSVHSTEEPSHLSQEQPKNKSYLGVSGTQVQLAANYIDLHIEPGKGLFQYEVKFMPEVDSTALRKKLLNQHAAALGKTKTFDGVLLYLPTMLSDQRTTLYSEHPMDGSKVTLTIIFKKQQKMSDNVTFFNILFGRILRALSMVRIGRQNFNPKCAQTIPQHHLEVWPGYITAVHEYENGLKLCIDAKHRVMRTDTVRDIMHEIFQKKKGNFKDSVMTEILGSSVLTRYNNKTYRIDDIAWDKDPTFVFDKKDDSKTSLTDYYKQHWDIVIHDLKQPLLVHRGKNRLPSGETEDRLILLVPELCYMSGITDNMRNDFRVMKDLDSVTKIGPAGRRDVIKRFIDAVKKNEISRDILAEWGLILDTDIARFPARLLDPEIIMFGNNKTFTPAPGRNIDWGSASVRNPVLRTPHLQNWIVLFQQRDSRCATDFINMVIKVSRGMGMQFSQPRTIVMNDDRSEAYVRELRGNINSDIELMVIIFSTNRTDRYAAVKKICCVEKPIPSQVIIARTISRADKLQSITQKIALQMNCKLGGALWALKIPFDNCMICGVDVYHVGEGKGARNSVAGFVASLDKLLTTWYSKVCIQGHRQEIVDFLQTLLISAVREYYKRNGRNPDRIILYRDGVGEGQFDAVANYEVKQLLSALSRIDPSYKPQLSVIIVHKRINTRLFAMNSAGLCNPTPGTIVDSFITKQNYYDFFLVSQHVRQGTVTPTYYIVIYDSTNMKPDHMQRLTHKLCHLYYNFAGTIRVPAPCQYAHKLVYLVGESIQAAPHESLLNSLFYL